MRQFIAGVFSGGVILAVMLTLRMSVGYVFLPELAAQKLFTSIPLSVELLLVRLLWEYAKYVGLTLVMVGFLGFYGFLALLYGRWLRHAAPRQTWLKGLLFGVLAAVLVGSLLSPLSGGGLFTAAGSLGPYSAGVLVALHVVFSLLLHTSTVRINRLGRNPTSAARQHAVKLPSRRIFVKAGAATSMALVLASYGASFLFPRQDPSQPIAQTEVSRSSKSANVPRIFQHSALSDFVASEVTSNDDFFVVSQNVLTPTIGVDGWSLIVDGKVSSALRFSYEDLMSLPSTSQFATLECVGNPLGGPYIGTAQWTGVPLRDILGRAGVREGGRYVVFHCADQYSAAIPLEKAMGDDVLLAHSMNGEPLEAAHGSPLRAVVPSLYGYLNPKWITRIEVVGEEAEGYWHAEGTDESSFIYTQSFIKTPHNRQVLPNRTPIAGVAFSGDRGIAKVEVSDDGGKTWVDATVKEPLSPYTWVLWAAEWLPNSNGEFTLMVRATDNTGRKQVAKMSEALKQGVMDYHVITVTLKPQRE